MTFENSICFSILMSKTASKIHNAKLERQFLMAQKT